MSRVKRARGLEWMVERVQPVRCAQSAADSTLDQNVSNPRPHGSHASGLRRPTPRANIQHGQHPLRPWRYRTRHWSDLRIEIVVSQARSCGKNASAKDNATLHPLLPRPSLRRCPDSAQSAPGRAPAIVRSHLRQSLHRRPLVGGGRPRSCRTACRQVHALSIFFVRPRSFTHKIYRLFFSSEATKVMAAVTAYTGSPHFALLRESSSLPALLADSKFP